MKDAQPDWRHLSDILQELTSFDHRFRRAFNDSFEIENAIANAIRSAEVAARGRRDNGFSSLTPAFERIEKYLGPKANIDIPLNRIIIPDDEVVLRPRRNLLQPQMNFGTFPGSITIPGSGAAGLFTDVQADPRGVETWIFENALPQWWREALAEESPRSRMGRPPDFDWDAVRNEAVSILNCKGEFDKRKPGWTCKARLEDHLMKFCFDEFGKEPVHSMLCVKISDWFPGLKDGRRKSRKVEK
jgi:hypothetical protein